MQDLTFGNFGFGGDGDESGDNIGVFDEIATHE